MRTLAGLGLQGADRDLAEAAALGIKDFLLLAPEGIEGGDLARLVALIPDVRIVVRLYSPDRMGTLAGPAASADYHWLCARTTPEQRRHIVAVTPANELNLDSEHTTAAYPGYWKSRAAYETIDRWLVVWASIWRTLNANDAWKPKLWWPALAPGHNPPGMEPESEYELVKDSMRLYDSIGIHVYGPISDEWTGAGRLKRIVDKLAALSFGTTPKAITECNQMRYSDLLRYASGFGIEAAYWFLWRSAGADHRPYDLKPPWSDGLADYIREGGQPMPETWDRAAVWADYKKRLDEFPAFDKYLPQHPELGGWIDAAEYDVGGIRLRGAIGGLVYAHLFYDNLGNCVGGDWAHVQHATYLNALPLAP